MLTLLFDTTVLGMGHFHPRAKTGIYRVAENLLFEFLKEPALRLQYVASEPLADTLSYLKSHGIGSKGQLASYHQSSQRKAQQCATLFDCFKLQSKPQKAIRRLTNWLPLHELPSFNFLQQQPAIYFSPFHPIPAALQQQPQVPKVLVLHDVIPLIFPDMVEEGNKEILQAALNSVDKNTTVVCVSESTKHDLLRHTSIPPNRVCVIPLAASSELFYPLNDTAKQDAVKRKYHIPLHLPYFLSVATLEPRKNIERLILAFAAYKGRHPESPTQLVLAGTKGWLLEGIFDTLKLASSVRQSIHLIGFVADEDLAALYSSALAFVYPSLYEGFGLPVLEAMQCGLPVITSNLSSLPEVAGQAGLLVNPSHEEAILEALELVAHNPQVASKLAQQSLQQAKQFSWHQTMLKYLELFHYIAPKR